jgi:hypothetical protein
MLCNSRISLLGLAALVMLVLPFQDISAMRLTAGSSKLKTPRDDALVNNLSTEGHKFKRKSIRRRLEEELANDEDQDETDENQDDDSREAKTSDPPKEVKAGANKAKFQFKSIDRFSTERTKQLKEHLKKHNGGGIQPPVVTSSRATTHHDVMTDKMKIHTPGTPEFQARQKSLMDHIEQHNAKTHNQKKLLDGKGTPTPPKAAETLRKDSLPYHKDVAKEHNIIRRTVAKLPGFHKLNQIMTLEEEMILDASVSFYTHLETSIYKTQDGKLMTEEEIIALSDWLDLVSLSLPPEWQLHKLVDDLRERFEFVAEGMDHMREILQQHRLRKKMWSHACTTDRGPFHVGFDCGFWKLLHIITLGVAEQRGGMNLVESGMVKPDTKTYSPSEAADVIRNMIQYYYIHGESFIEAYDDCSNQRRCDRLTEDKEGATVGDWKELALWLWEVHNEIAVKALKEQKAMLQKKIPKRSSAATVELTEEEEMEVMWPTVEQCYLCFEEDGTWNENEIFYYLEDHYWYVCGWLCKCNTPISPLRSVRAASQLVFPCLLLACLLFVAGSGRTLTQNTTACCDLKRNNLLGQCTFLGFWFAVLLMY